MKSDVSHRIRRRPSIFGAAWFRACLGAGVTLALVLLVGPRVAGWLGSDLPRSLLLLTPWSGEGQAPPVRSSEPVIDPPAPAKPAPVPPATGASPGVAGAAGPASGEAGEGERGPAKAVAGRAPAPAAPARPSAPSAPSPPAGGPGRPAAGAVAAPEPADALSPPPAAYWVQAGAFLDHANAERLAERLRGDGLPAATTAFEQSRVLYRVLLAGPDGAAVPEDAIARVRGLGHPVETTVDGPAVTGSVPLRKAVETSHALRQQGVQVRLKQEVSSSTFRVVRVGSFATAAEAEAALATLTAKGLEGIVVRER